MVGRGSEIQRERERESERGKGRDGMKGKKIDLTVRLLCISSLQTLHRIRLS